MSVMELATQLNDRLVRADERVADVGKLLSAKRMEAIRKLDQTYGSFKEKVDILTLLCAAFAMD